MPGSPPGESVDLLDRSAASLRCASQCGDAAQRYVEAHLGALRAAAAVVAARSVPSRRSRPRSVWQVLTEVAPELTEWAAFFAAHAEPGTAPEPLLVLASGGHRVDTAALAGRLGLHQVARADAEWVKERTGFAIGGVAPVGHLHRLRTVVDTALAAYDVVWAAAGHPHAVFPTTYAELLRLTEGEPHAVD